MGRSLAFRDKLLVFFLVFLILGSGIFWGGYYYLNHTRPVAKAGGEYVEGILGQPVYVNPLLSQTSEADADLTQLIYSGLFKYGEQGQVVPDLAEKYELSEDGKTYRVTLREGVTWHDGEQLTAEDVHYTLTLLQDPAYKSPLRQNWLGTEVRLLDERTLEFNLKNPYFAFLENLTVGILPKHIWQDFTAEKFALAQTNLQPIGSGPFVFNEVAKDSTGTILSYKLVANKNFYVGAPLISKFTVNFYQDEDSLLAAFNKKEVMGMGGISPDKVASFKNPKTTNLHELALPRYFALFFNQTKNVALADADVRQALNLALNREGIVEEIIHGEGQVLYSPFLKETPGYREPAAEIKEFNLEKSRTSLEEKGWKQGEGGIRAKGSSKLEFEIVTADWPELVENAELLKLEWEKIGARVNVKVLPIVDLQQNYIKTREYDSLLFGQQLSFAADLWLYWHSSNKRDPGLNLALFEDKEFDGLVDAVRQENNPDKRQESFGKMQEIFERTRPALFLYSRAYLYPQNTQVGGFGTTAINSHEYRFADVTEWYVKTKRVWK